MAGDSILANEEPIFVSDPKHQDLFRITVAEDKLSAYLQIRKQHDGSLENVLFAEILAAMERENIRSNLDFTAIREELKQPTYQPVPIAKGKEAVPGTDGHLELYFSDAVENRFFEVSGLVDFRNHLVIPSVKRGDVIARKIPPASGIPGYDVHGNLILPDPPRDITVSVRPSVQLTPDGELIALIDGRPKIMGRDHKLLDISTSYIVYGNVDMDCGNVVFSGDVIVYGSVMDGMLVESLGNVYVFGNVHHASIAAAGSILIKGNVLGSKLYSGRYGVVNNRLYRIAQSLEEEIGKLPDEGCKYAAENRFSHLERHLKELMIAVSNFQHTSKEAFRDLYEITEGLLQSSKSLNHAEPETIHRFVYLLRKTQKDISRMQEEKTKVKFSQCHNTSIKSDGDIVIVRDGVVLSELHADGNIVFEQEDAVCRGSKLTAGDSIKARIVGGQTGAPSYLMANQLISVTVMQNGRICIKNHCLDIDEPVEYAVYNLQRIKQAN